MEILSSSVEETRTVGAQLAATASVGDIFALSGELGTGKTELVRGFVAALSDSCSVRSPSFTILNTYETPHFPIYHFDFYRLKKAQELIEIGFSEYIQGEGVCFIEWADLFPEVMPSHTRSINFIDKGNGQRLITMQ